MKPIEDKKGNLLQTPKLITFFLENPLAAFLWLPLRLWLGWQWIEAGWEKVFNPGWMVTGDSLKGYWEKAVVVSERSPIAYDWYRNFILTLLNNHSYQWFAKFVVIGEIVVGVLLILGIFTALAAFAGGFMNWNYIMAGSASVNGMFLVISFGLIIAWKVAGYIGLDYFILNRLPLFSDKQKK